VLSLRVADGVANVALDYVVLDHIVRVAEGRYEGCGRQGLERLESLAADREIVAWVSEISWVEMLQGQEKAARHPGLDAFRRRDDAKRRVAEKMRARVLGYPCSRCDDDFSRLELSVRCAGSDWEWAFDLEKRLLATNGVSRGDARHLVCCAFPFDADSPNIRPKLDWFVSEDHALVRGLGGAVARGELPELAHMQFGLVAELVATLPAPG
jgi:hypothetical protein